jgi:serine/threonine-protein kinase
MLDLLDRIQAALADRYAVEREVGHGGMAVVYRARDLRHDRTVAVKVLRANYTEVLGAERFLREIRLAARLHHPHLLPLYDSGESGDPRDPTGGSFLYYVTPYIEGGSLRDKLALEGRLPVGPALRLTRQAAEALDYAHRQGVIHRDVKPENILLEEGHAVVADFGVARAVTAAADRTITQAGMLVGTPAYMSPEQASDAPVDARSDIYALGSVLFELLAGRAPFPGTTPIAIIAARMMGPAPALGAVGVTVPPSVERLVATALASHPAERFQTAADFASTLADAEAELGRPTPTPAPASFARTGRAAAVAVLPFVNLSADPENEFFSDGMTEELISALARINGLRVASRTSVFACKGKDLDIGEIAHRLKVGAIVEGSVRRSGTRLRVTAQLINAADGYQLWSESYDRKLSDIFEVQDELSRAIVATLRPKLQPNDAGTLVVPATTNLDAYTAYLKGRFFWNKRTPDAMQKGIEYFEQALQADPEYAPAHAGLADAYHILGVYGVLEGSVAYPKARAAARRALQIDPLMAEAHVSAAYVAFAYDWSWLEAERAFRRALELNPGYAPAHHWLAWLLVVLGRHGEAAGEARAAAELEPLSPLINARVGHILTLAGLPDEGVAASRRALELDPGYVFAYETLALGYIRQRRYDEALATLTQGSRLPASTTPFMVPWVLALNEAFTEARRALEALHLGDSASAGPPGYADMWVAGAYAELGETDAAFRLVERSIMERRYSALMLNVDQAFDKLRPDPRFPLLVARVGLTLPIPASTRG